MSCPRFMFPFIFLYPCHFYLTAGLGSRCYTWQSSCWWRWRGSSSRIDIFPQPDAKGGAFSQIRTSFLGIAMCSLIEFEGKIKSLNLNRILFKNINIARVSKYMKVSTGIRKFYLHILRIATTSWLFWLINYVKYTR